MRNEEEFRLFYNQTIQPELARMDKLRRRLIRLILFSAVIMVGVVALVYYISVFVVALLAAIPFWLYIMVVWRRVRKFVDTFKPNIVKLVLDFIDNDTLFGELRYEPKKKIPKERFLASKLFITNPAVYEGEDFIEGRIGDVEFEMCELNVKEFSQVRNRLDPVFRGVFLRAKFFTEPKGILLILPRARLPYLSETAKHFVREGGLPMEGFIRNDLFKKTYLTYGSRNLKISELLPEQLMKFFVGYRREKGEMYIAIHGRYCYVGISNEKDILEPKIFQSNVSFELVKEFYDDIYTALYIVEALDKNH